MQGQTEKPRRHNAATEAGDDEDLLTCETVSQSQGRYDIVGVLDVVGDFEDGTTGRGK